jgi:hypothetical protein
MDALDVIGIFECAQSLARPLARMHLLLTRNTDGVTPPLADKQLIKSGRLDPDRLVAQRGFGTRVELIQAARYHMQ